ncbi:MAG: hypothetical protein JSV91_06435 [Phycisphaerales bacterium]|nr:MAG: hypothetical protein JSV91_06435 [Phycisphaerales bacterium]
MKRTRDLWPLALMLAAGMIIGSVAGGSPRSARGDNDRSAFEYRVESVPVAATGQYEKVFEKYRRDGWRLVEVEGAFLFFERVN